MRLSNVIDVSDQRKRGTVQHADQEPLTCLAAPLELRLREQTNVDLAAELALERLEHGQQFLEPDRTDHEDVYVATGVARAAGDGAVEKSDGDLLSKSPEGSAELLWQAAGLQDQAAQLVEHRVLAVGLVDHAVAVPGARDQVGRDQPRELELQRPWADARPARELA
jgi:hypothetical protein